MQNATTQVLTDAVIDLGDGNQLTLVGINENDLHQDDFLFS